MTVIVSGLLFALKGIALQLIATTGTKWALERLLFLIGDMIVKSTKTTHDDEWFKDLKERYFKYEEKK